MELTWTRNNREIWYLTAIVLVSLVLASLRLMDIILWNLPISVFSLFLYLRPIFPHFPAFLYGIYTQTDWNREGVSGQKANYLLALFISAPFSFFVTLRTSMTFPPSPMYYPVWQIEVPIVIITLLIPTFHAYFAYKKYGDIRMVMMIILIYAPWVQFVRTVEVYMHFI